MAHITSIGAGIYSDLSVATAVLTSTELATTASTAKADFDALMDSANLLTRIKDVREFPSMGTPANIVNVPVYGQSTSQQVQGQADAPNLEITINYVASEWADGSVLGDYVGDGLPKLFRFTLLNAEPVSVLPADDYGSSALGLGTVENTYFYFIGKMEALLVNPQLTDANTATLTLSAQSEFFGSFTV
jgi:hypothetical protein